jgi:hypothetical protein
MDSWFTMPATVVALAQHLKVIGMVKKSPRIHYAFNGQSLDLKAIYRRIRKRRGRAKILASADVMLKEKVAAKLVFVRDRRKKDWLALLSTDIQLSDAEIVRIYGKRWDIEVFFKMAKQHLKLAKEIQCRDFDALIAHTTIVFMRYMFLAYQCRMETDHRTFGHLFYACCEEAADISFVFELLDGRITPLGGEPGRRLNIAVDLGTTTIAIDGVVYDPDQDAVRLSIIQGHEHHLQPAAGICGAGFLSALVRNGIIKPDGALNPECRSHHIIDVNSQGRCFRLTAEQADGNGHHVAIYQSDVRALQLAKGAVAAGIHMLCQKAGMERPHNIILAGAMGNYIDIADARAIGLFPDQVPVQVVVNAAGAGAILAAMAPASRVHFQDLARGVTAINLSTETRFQAIFLKKTGISGFDQKRF